MSDLPRSTGSTAPSALLERLPACVHNPFGIGEALTAQLATAVNRQVSLYELEHDFTPDGQLDCEVYADEAAADRAAERHAFARGTGGRGGE